MSHRLLPYHGSPTATSPDPNVKWSLGLVQRRLACPFPPALDGPPTWAYPWWRIVDKTRRGPPEEDVRRTHEKEASCSIAFPVSPGSWVDGGRLQQHRRYKGDSQGVETPSFLRTVAPDPRRQSNFTTMMATSGNGYCDERCKPSDSLSLGIWMIRLIRKVRPLAGTLPLGNIMLGNHHGP
ncbi:hypothetical protein FKM82_019025 [Ascaphus truei]